MLTSTLRSAALALLASSSPVLAAQPGTSEEAQAIQKRLERYVGKTAFADRYVTITPDAEGYRMAMDLSPLMSRLENREMTMEVSPFEFRISRRADGNWDVAGDQPLRVRGIFPVAADGKELEIEIRATEAPFEAVVADGTGTVLSSSGKVGSMEMREEDARAIERSSFGPSTYRSQAHDSGPGLVDTTTTQTLASSREVMALKPAAASAETGEPGANPFGFGPMTTTTREAQIDTSVSGMRAEAIQNLWALMVERLESDDVDGDTFRENLRSALRALGPLWDDLDAGYSMRDLSLKRGSGARRSPASSRPCRRMASCAPATTARQWRWRA